MPKFTPPKRADGFFVGENEKDELIDNGTEMEVISVERRTSPFDSKKEQYIITVTLDDTERGVSFTCGVNSRDELLAALQDYLDNEQDQETVTIKLAKVKSSNGRWVKLVQVVGADEEE